MNILYFTLVTIDRLQSAADEVESRYDFNRLVERATAGMPSKSRNLTLQIIR